MTYEEARAQYKSAVKNWLSKNNYCVTMHVEDIMVSTLMHRDKIIPYPAGSFITAILTNDLKSAINFADSDCQTNLVNIYKAYHNIDTWHIARTFKQQETQHV